MTTVRIPEGQRLRWRPSLISLAWLLLLIAVGGVLGWFWWECSRDRAPHEQQIADLEAGHAAVVAGLVERNQELQAQHAAEITALNDEKAALAQRVADLEMELKQCQANVAGLRQRTDRLEAELDACLQSTQQPRPLQVILPDLMRDNTTSVFVIDDSGSMAPQIVKVQESLEKMQHKPSANAVVSMMLFGDSHTTLFDFTDAPSAPWGYAISMIKAAHGGTDIDQALQVAFDSLKDEPNPNKRIVLLSDGHGFADAATLAAISGANIPVDTIAFGLFADRILLSQIAQATGGEYTSAN